MSQEHARQAFRVDRTWARKRFLVSAELYLLSIAGLGLAMSLGPVMAVLAVFAHAGALSLACKLWVAQSVVAYTLEEDAIIIDFGIRTRRVRFADVDSAVMEVVRSAPMTLWLSIGKEVLKLPLNGAQHDALVRGVRARLGPGVASPELMQFAGLPSKGFWVAPPDLDALAAQVKEGRHG